MDNENYISPNKITKQYDITSGTLRRWSEAGKIRCLRPNGGKRIYNIEDIKKIFNAENKLEEKDNNTNLNDDLKKVFANLKQNIQNDDGVESIKFIETELRDLMVLISDLKKK
jgi:DNA-binding transcriptional MerR regulator